MRQALGRFAPPVRAMTRGPGVTAPLHYQKIVEGKRVGRYIAPCPDAGELADEHDVKEVFIENARQLAVQPNLETKGFELRKSPTQCPDFTNDDEIQRVYYPEVEKLVKEATGCARVFVFDHTLRSSSAQSLNTLGAKSSEASAASVVRVHTDYTLESAPKRLAQLADEGSYTGYKMTPEEKASVLAGRYTFINVWRSVTDDPVEVRPMAFCEAESVEPEEWIHYEMHYPNRVGGNYALAHKDTHKWYYYPRMVKDECVLFKVYDKADEPWRARTVYHTAFDAPDTRPDAPVRKSLECRAIAVFPEAKPLVFYDMVHSNNAARIRLWLRFKQLQEQVTTKMITYADLQDPAYLKVNPLKKVPGLVLEDGNVLFESQVILNYLEDKYEGVGAVPSFTLGTAEQRAFVGLLCRIHDLYIASPNCTQPGFSHSQGAMYLSPYETKWCAKVRCMDKPTRAAKLAELWKQLTWLDENLKGPYLAGPSLTLADFTWFPTCIFIEFMVPRVFDWPEVFHDPAHFPNLVKWFALVSEDPIFKQVRQEIWDFWVGKHEEGQFESIKLEIKDPGFKWKYP